MNFLLSNNSMLQKEMMLIFSIYYSRSAEKHYVEAGDWKSAVHMSRGTDAWEDAYRVAQSHGGPNAAKQVRYSLDR